MTRTSQQVLASEWVDELEAPPEGWVFTSVSDVCDINPPKVPSNALEPDQPITFVPMPAVDAEKGAITAPQERLFSEVRSGYTSFQDEDVIMAKITPCMENGKAAIARSLTNGLGFGSTEFHVLRSNGAVLPEYVYYFVRQESFRRAAEAEMTGSVGQKRVPQRFLYDAELPLPPLAEQKRIVEKVEQLLSRVNAARERLARVPVILKRFRQAVLAAACSGRLSEDWREHRASLPSVQKLYDRAQSLRAEKYEHDCKLAERARRRKPNDPRKADRSNKPVIELPNLPNTWKYFPLQDLCFLITDGTHRTPKYLEEGIAFLSVKNVRSFAILDDDIKRISPKEHAEINARCNPEQGDILYTKVGSYGYAAANRLAYPFSLFVSVALVKPVSECLTTNYAEIVMNSEVVFAQARDRVSGSGTPDLHLVEIRDFRIPLPPLEEQHEMVRQVEALFKLADAIERSVAAATRRAEKLTQAILAKAFQGELVATEAELARREGRSYEPASVLLARILDTRSVSMDPSQASPGVRRGRRKKS